MSTTPTSSPKPRPERSFSLNKIRGALRRTSKGSADTPNGSSPEASEGRPSIDTPPNSPPPNVTTTPGSPTPAGSQRKPSSLRRMSLDVVRPSRHGRSGSVSLVPPAADGSTAAPATNGTGDNKEAAKEDFDPFSESHDDKSKPRGWRKTVKGALRRTASRLSTSSAHSAGKAPSIDKEVSGDGAAAVPPLASPPAVEGPVPSGSTDDAKVSPVVPETAAESKAAEASEASQEGAKEDKEEAKDATPPVALEASTSLEWEHVDTAEAEHATPSAPIIQATPSVEVTPSAEQEDEDEDVAEAKSGLAPLNVSSRHLMPLRSEMAELSPIMESPLTAARDDGEIGLMIPIHEAATALHAPSVPAIEESYVEVPHLSEAATAAEDADVANASYSTPLASPPRSTPPAGAIVVDVTPATLKPSPAGASGSHVTASPALNAIELGNGGVEASGDAKKEVANSSTPLLANRSASTSSANNGQEASTDAQQPSTVSALSFVSNTAWFVGACVVVGIGMVVGQVRSYRQVQRRSTSTLSSYFTTVKRWLRLA
ncbi:hypothetical protein BKA70DRAFT_197899 [Coprinopsis sp. MPI-PUGE-AT-0042]|nr:hypothetical protein BKA70DRAFT_197899 [Coprinopsis sp. MPI-PUGE-AT-0042]